MNRTFHGVCSCGGIVLATDDWENGHICIMGQCQTCKQHYLEEDLDWMEDK